MLDWLLRIAACDGESGGRATSGTEYLHWP